MRKILKALLIAGAATGAAALLLRFLRLDEMDEADDAGGFPGMEPEDFSEDDLENLMDELASQLEL